MYLEGGNYGSHTPSGSMGFRYKWVHHCIATTEWTETEIFPHTWQSRVKNKHYSIVYFDHVTTFKVLYLKTSVKGGVHTRCVETSHIDATAQHIISPPLMRYSTLNAVL